MRANAHSSIDSFTHSLFDEYLLSVPCVLAVGAQRRAKPNAGRRLSRRLRQQVNSQARIKPSGHAAGSVRVTQGRGRWETRKLG